MEQVLTESRTDSRAAAGGASALLSSCATGHSSPARPSRFAGKRVHFVGIGGSGMNGLARILMDCGATVSGSDPNPNPQTLELDRRGARISRGQAGELLSTDTDLVVRTAAIKDTNAEYLAACRYGLCVVKYAELLGQVMQERLGVAVAGTHGKSTTTAMIAHALLQCGLDPSFVVGGTAPQLGGTGSHSGGGRAFVAEACEFDRSFHNLRPTVALITNIEEDHLDCYSGIDDIVQSFRRFAQLVPPGGLIVANGQDARVGQAIGGLPAPVEWVAIDREATWSTRVLGVDHGRYHGQVLYRGRAAATLRLSVPGAHNLFNATMAVAACHACGLEPARAAGVIDTFRGVDRRMTEVGTCNGATVVDDYGHHPTEIRATLKALRQRYEPRRLFCVFQPHQHSRTRFLLEDFATSFGSADETVVPEIYFVRDSEEEKNRISAAHLVERITRSGQQARHLADFPAIVSYLRAELRPGDLVVTMGAGNVWEIGRDLVGA